MAAGVRFTPYINPQSGISYRERYERLRAGMWEEKVQNEPHWRDLNDYVAPRRGRFFVSDRNKGDRRNQKIIDSTGTFAWRTMQSGMHAGMTNPARPWMKLLTPDPDLNEYEPVKHWLHQVTQRMLVVFAQTNLYNALPVHYGCKGLFATAATAILADDDALFRAYSYPIGSYAIATDKRGKVNQWVHEEELTVLEVVERYLVDKRTNMIDWSKASNTVRQMWDQHNYNSRIPVCWMVVPNMAYSPSRSLSPRHAMPYSSIHIEKGQERDDTFLRESGFNEFPILVSRWDVTGSDWWGTDCPGMVALGDIKQLQTGERKSMQAVEKMLNPPLQAPTAVRNQKASLLPGDITYNDVREGQKGITPIHETAMPIDQLEVKQEGCRYRVRRAFYEDLFLMINQMDGIQPRNTAEIAERKEEKLIALGPVLERSKDELHDPLIDRTFAMGMRRGLWPEPPDEIRGVALRVEYTSIMAQAQKLVGVAGTERFLQGASALVAVWPEARHKVNVFQALDNYNDMLGNDPNLVVPDEDARDAANAEAQQAAQMAQAKAMRDQAGAVQSLAKSPVGGQDPSALDAMAESMGAL